MITIRGYEVDVDVARELNKYDWNRARFAGEKFLACSPFRNERHPSFAVRLDNGVWIDSGSDDEEWRKGNFVKLLAWLRNETYEETEDYLLVEYRSLDFKNVDELELNLNLSLEEEKKFLPLNSDVLKPYLFRHSYLGKERGIEERYQRAFRVGYCKQSRAITFPWFDKNGSLINIKFRSVKDKRFWYYAGGQPIKKHLYGLHIVYKTNSKRVFVVESEIDCITLWQNQIPAIALGGANLTKRQRELILQSPIETVVIATDNDKAGKKIAKSIIQELNGLLELEEIILPEYAKDVNDLSSDEIMSIVDKTRSIGLNFSSV
ncbi:toprim domain-containing protein [Fredinandcohnia humi]